MVELLDVVEDEFLNMSVMIVSNRRRVKRRFAIYFQGDPRDDGAHGREGLRPDRYMGCAGMNTAHNEKGTMQKTIFASEAFAAIEHVPSPKAWVLGDDGSVTLMGRYTLTKRENGRLSVVDQEGRSLQVPLMITAEFCRHASVIPQTMFDGLERDHEAYVRLVEACAPGVPVDKRLSPDSRRILRCVDATTIEDMPEDAFYGYRHDRADQIRVIARQVADQEERSLGRRLRVSTLGYRRGSVGCAKLINAYMWADFYDRDIARATIAAFGREATTVQYDDVASSWSVPLTGGRDAGIGTMVRTHRPAIILLPALLKAWSDPELCDKGVAGCVVANAANDDALPRDCGRLARVVADAPAALKRAGLKPAVWRMMLRMSDPQIAALSNLVTTALGTDRDSTLCMFGDVPYPNRPDPSIAAVAILNRMAELGAETAPRTFLRTISFLPEERRALLPLYLGGLLDGGRRARRRKLVKDQAFNIGLIADAFDALHRAGDAVARTPNLGWTALTGLSTRWHANADFGSAEALTLAWTPLLPEHSTPIASATELCDGMALAREGREMGHCVAGYAHACATMRTRIFALRTAKGPHRSTAEFSLGNDGTWRMVQHRAKGNQRPTGGLAGWIRSLTTAINKAQKRGSEGPSLPMRLAA